MESPRRWESAEATHNDMASRCPRRVGADLIMPRYVNRGRPFIHHIDIRMASPSPKFAHALVRLSVPIRDAPRQTPSLSRLHAPMSQSASALAPRHIQFRSPERAKMQQKLISLISHRRPMRNRAGPSVILPQPRTPSCQCMRLSNQSSGVCPPSPSFPGRAVANTKAVRITSPLSGVRSSTE